MRLFEAPKQGPEISDRIIDFDPETLERRPVKKADVIEEFDRLGNPWAAKIVSDIPATRDGALDEGAVDQLLIKIHCEMQRMSEEFQHGQRVAELLEPLIQVLRDAAVPTPIRIVDVGCGSGFVIRWLTANASFGDDVELIGADYNSALIAEAKRLALAENLSSRFMVANAFRLEQTATLIISTGVLHHFRDADLLQLFKLHDHPKTHGFVHFDFHPSPVAPFGSWLFHAARMREPLAKHDGVLSAMRAHSSAELLTAAREGAPNFVSAIYGTKLWGLPIPRAFHALVGMRAAHRDGFLARMANRIPALGVIE
jgi:SAM-dependent methyltransferase